MDGNAHMILGGRDRCSHNLRLRLQGKSNICLICECNKIDDLLMVGCNRNRKLSSENISEIIHHQRIINSVLDVTIDEQYVEPLLSPVLQTCLALLKIHNEELGVVVAEALDKIKLKAHMNMLEDFLGELSAQILEKISYGSLDCLSVLIRRKECLQSFFRNHGSLVLPRLFEALENHASNPWKCFPSSSKIPATQSTEINNQESQMWCGVSGGGGSVSILGIGGREMLKTTEKLFDIIDANCPSDACLVVTTIADDNKCEALYSPRTMQNQRKQEFPVLQQTIPIYNQFLRGIIFSCMKLLNFIESSFATKILNFLGKLHHYPESLRCVFSDNTGMTFCSMVKKQLFFTNATDVKIAALSLVNRMVATYKTIMEANDTDKEFIADLPHAISQVDLIHFITETLNTSCENQFRTAIEVLDQINTIPLFRMRMISVLESALRIATMNIPKLTVAETYTSLHTFILNILTTLGAAPPPSTIQRQLIYLFEKLPEKWTAFQYLSWIKLLLFCREDELQEKLWSLLLRFIHPDRLESCKYSVVQTKCILLIAYALTKCKCVQTNTSLPGCSQQQIFGQTEILSKHPMHFIMNPNIFPAIMVLVRFGTSDDSMYITALLELLKHYPEDYFTTCNQVNFENRAYQTVKVAMDSDIETDLPGNVYEIIVDPDGTMDVDGKWYWSTKLVMQILAAVRLNSEFILSRQLYDLWNTNFAKIISICYPVFLPQLKVACGINSKENYDCNADREEIKRILKNLDIDVSNWSKRLGQYAFSEEGIHDAEKQAEDNMILAVFFCFALYAGDTVMQLLDREFEQRYSIFLGECHNQHDLTQETNDKENEFDWNRLSYQYRVALMLASVLPDEKVPHIADKLEFFLLDDQAKAWFNEDVLIYNCNVFVFLLRYKILSDCYVSLVENWFDADKAGCKSFYSRAYVDKELNEEINNSLLSIAAEGSEQNSLLAVELAFKRIKSLKLCFDFNAIKATIQKLAGKISTIEVDRKDLESNLIMLQFANVIRLANEDDHLFCTNNEFPPDFLLEITHIMLKFQDESHIGARCLEFISKILRSSMIQENVRCSLISHKGFIKFLGNRLKIAAKDDVIGSTSAYKILTTLIQHNVENFALNKISYGEPPWINWELTSLFSYLHLVPKIEILEFLGAMCKLNFTCPLIRVKELDLGPSKFENVLQTLFFHLQALSTKVGMIRDFNEAVWDVLCEITRFGVEENGLVNHSRFCIEVLFQPWVKVTVVHLLARCNHIPSKAPLKALQFLEMWTKMLVINKLKNPSTRTPLQQLFVFQSFTSVFKILLHDMKRDPSQTQNEELSQSQMMFTKFDSHERLFEIEKKSEIISQIAKNCEIFNSIESI